MKNIINIIVTLILLVSLSSCGRDLSNTTYTSDSTTSIVLEAVVVSKRAVNIKESERLGDNSAGAAIGAIGGGLGAGRASGGNSVAAVGGAAVGGLAGALVQQGLSTTKGIEYIVKVDRSKIADGYYEGSAMIRNALSAAKTTGVITVIQSREGEADLTVGKKVLVVISEKKSMIIPDNSGY